MASEHDDEPTARRRPRRRRPRVPVRAVAFAGVLAAGVLIGWVLFGGDDGTRAPAQQATSTAPAGRQPVRILSMAVSSRWRTYSVQVFTVVAPRARRLLELRSLLSSVGYRQPR